MYVLGVFLHFAIALSAATIYYAASRKLGFLKEHPLVCGLFYGADHCNGHEPYRLKSRDHTNQDKKHSRDSQIACAPGMTDEGL
jgi:hypothetical protein